MSAVGRWWRQSDHFDWLSLYLNTRGIRLVWRAMIAAVIASIAVLPVVVVMRPALPHSRAALIVSPIAGGVGVVLALLWLFRWPTRGRSVLFSVTSNGCIAAVCLVQSDPRVGLLGCTAFAVLGGYIAFFHTAPYLMANFVVAMGTTAVLAARLVGYYDLVLAGCAFLLVHFLNVAFPFAVQSLVHALGSDVRRSSRDMLTGLLTRRAFYQSAYALLLRPRTGDTYLGVAVIDLDQFKRLNDTRGHPTGDKALVAVGGALHLCRPPTAIIGRVGGEEFVVADTYSNADLHSVAEQLRNAVAAIPYPVTASVGIASAILGAAFTPTERPLIEQLINHADSAMYTAKHAGGNQSRATHIAPTTTN
ncbi:MAG: GGDEF domain-containing protein [Mycobacterium sp.]|uniref:GGDEF domain-containing protein n=1 Tax=Mycobacterium sp. TaxID=1785 RepID=UPI003CC50493